MRPVALGRGGSALLGSVLRGVLGCLLGSLGSVAAQSVQDLPVDIPVFLGAFHQFAEGVQEQGGDKGCQDADSGGQQTEQEHIIVRGDHGDAADDSGDDLNDVQNFGPVFDAAAGVGKNAIHNILSFLVWMELLYDTFVRIATTGLTDIGLFGKILTMSWKGRGFMKRIGAILLLGVMCLSLCGCGILDLLGMGTFERLSNDALERYPRASISRGRDGSFLKIDTNPDDLDTDDLSDSQKRRFWDISEDSCSAIEYCNKELGFTEAVFQRMIETTSLMGRQTADSSRYTVSWTYHPDRGLEVMYEKK